MPTSAKAPGHLSSEPGNDLHLEMLVSQSTDLLEHLCPTISTAGM